MCMVIVTAHLYTGEHSMYTIAGCGMIFNSISEHGLDIDCGTGFMKQTKGLSKGTDVICDIQG